MCLLLFFLLCLSASKVWVSLRHFLSMGWIRYSTNGPTALLVSACNDTTKIRGDSTPFLSKKKKDSGKKNVIYSPLISKKIGGKLGKIGGKKEKNKGKIGIKSGRKNNWG